MIKRKTALKIRKAHRYLGIFLGIQFLMWTISGMYFSWTDIDEIHGDHFKKESVSASAFENLVSPSELATEMPVSSLELREIAGKPYYWVNEAQLFDAGTGSLQKEISEEDALLIAQRYMLEDLKPEHIERIEEAGSHSEYRGRPLPAYVISYQTPEHIKAYVSVKDGAFQTLRHRDWRWFDFLWMTHTMDYQGRDNFNSWVLRVFSLLGLITVLSGFLLWYVSSPSVRKWKKKAKK
ncbi:PepSY domain-containing protein [Psychroflexus sediminis]|uniref:PepSY-associated TM region n=1 Tax=Psychroflexus sediminis TaxID=470826 RepID=A0A1G7VXZ3_9FLAO|nr:PepSY domain-containing protein [Psychroflexus sediminis]SDG64607.1 PepSY-associated TM region [Psychroflexus sediminis]